MSERKPRAALVITGSELVRGERTDLNGPYLARELLALGLEPARLTIVGDRPDELENAIRDGMTHDLCICSGGLGPTHDDRTIELIATCAGVGLRVVPELEAEIEAISRSVADRLRRPYADFAHGVVKQATIPVGAVSLGLAGTAPGVLLDTGSCVVVSLPGPPGELRRLWQNAREAEAVKRVLARTAPPTRRVLRFHGASESAVAQALSAAGGDGDGVEATICARDFEIHVDLIVEPGAEGRAEALATAIAAPVREHLFAEDERPVEQLVLDACGARGWSLGTAESCTGGLVAARLTSRPGSSAVFKGAVVAYADEVKERDLGVPGDVLRAHGAVSPETARAMAHGAREHLGVDVAVSVTGVAGPDGGTPEKPVGTVFLHAVSPEGERGLDFSFPGDRDVIRSRSAVVALHLVRRLLTETAQSGHEHA